MGSQELNDRADRSRRMAYGMNHMWRLAVHSSLPAPFSRITESLLLANKRDGILSQCGIRFRSRFSGSPIWDRWEFFSLTLAFICGRTPVYRARSWESFSPFLRSSAWLPNHFGDKWPTAPERAAECWHFS